MYNIGSKTRRI